MFIVAPMTGFVVRYNSFVVVIVCHSLVLADGSEKIGGNAKSGKNIIEC